MKLSTASEAKLKGLHPDLIKVVHRTAETTATPFAVIEGMRTLATQKKYVAAGKSKTMNSRHLTGHAIDLAPVVDGKISWDWDDFWPLVYAVEQAARDVGVPIEAGARWTKFPDGPHFQLPWTQYPK